MSSGSYDSSKDASSGNNSSYDYNRWNKPSEVIVFPTPIRPADSGIYALEQMGAAMRNSPNTVRTYVQTNMGYDYMQLTDPNATNNPYGYRY
ncbi:unnamed protein product [Rotaria magnacalcarata]|uniref:Uncharacterized protein n=2 Tax=Rotaria magnacalcarata TaxID=392030 RepID=A0A818ZDA6_9BILA|nr:unnamed protein product [Rotaria magnacalcarata]CAF2186441.1 unnamed protein product [Rotaria magnacalcarata]CAF3766916.1 unnamed protein product [Rotaria magnacalcarata]CAF5066579.1 unnamed protein product [Rotaria magnacalcarata]CAF5176852.1 unnamed protein product [Rotaria magnacalcarata]